MILSESYIAGIVDERGLHRQLAAEGVDAATIAPDILANILATLRGFPSGPVAEYLRGARDFWRHQIKAHRRA